MAARPPGSGGRSVGRDDGRRDRSTEVGVHDDDAAARLGERGGEVDGHRRLALCWTRRGHEDGTDAVVVGQRLAAGSHERDRRPQGSERLGDAVVLVGPDDESCGALLAVERRQLADHGGPERLLRPAAIAQLGIESLDREREPGAEHGADGGRERDPCRPGTWGGEAAGLGLHRLRTLERGQRDVGCLVRVQLAVVLVLDAVLADGGVAPGDEDGVGVDRRVARLAVGVALGDLLRHLPVELLDLGLQRVHRRLGRRLTLRPDLVLAHLDVVDGLLGERIGDADGVLGIGLLGGERQRPRRLVLGHRDLRRQRGRDAPVAELFGHPGRHLAAGGQHRHLGERDRADLRLEPELVGVHQQRVGRGVLRLDRLGLGVGADERERGADQRTDGDEGPPPQQCSYVLDRLHHPLPSTRTMLNPTLIVWAVPAGPGRRVRFRTPTSWRRRPGASSRDPDRPR